MQNEVFVSPYADGLRRKFNAKLNILLSLKNSENITSQECLIRTPA